MTTVINNPSKAQNRDSLPNVLMITVLVLVFLGLFFMYILPAMRGNEEVTSDTNAVSIEAKADLNDTTLSSTGSASSD